ncbi:MAG: hypothetical protein MZV70_51080 [Desulfobacterales bacterium]|nr:hypothetical protein [Desulfobacterales bacterium]
MIFFKRWQFSGMLLGGMLFLAIGSGIFLGPSVVNAEINDRLADCSKIEDDAARLQCFDELAGRKNPAPQAADTATVTMPVAKEASSETDKLSVMEQTLGFSFRQPPTLFCYQALPHELFFAGGLQFVAE